MVTRNKTTKNAWNNATMTKIITKWSDYRFKGGNHSVTNIIQIGNQRIFQSFLCNL